MTSEEKTSGEMVTSQSVSFSDVVHGFVKEDYTEFTDFPSSEDLDAFLADTELDCENILQKTPSASADAMRSADPFELQLKVEVSRTLASNKHDIKENTKRNNTENSDNVLDFTIGDCFFTQKDPVRQQWVRKSDSNVNQMPVLDIELSDSQFLRNCNTVFTELSEKSIRENDMRGKKQWSQFFVALLSSFTNNNQRKPTHCGEEIIKQGKAVCRLESMKELFEEEVVNCTTSLEREELNKWSHDQDKNETEIQQIGSKKAVSCFFLISFLFLVIHWQMTC